MVAMAHPNQQSAGTSDDPEADAIVQEAIADIGLRRFMAACLRSDAGEHFDKFGGNAALRISQVILREIVFSKDPQLEAEVMALGAGFFLEDKANMTRLAKKHGITKQALSKRVVSFCEKNKLPPSTYMRSEKDRRTYALTNQPRTA